MGARVISEARMPTVIREVMTPRPPSVGEGEIEMDQSLNDDSRLSSANMASHSVDGTAMLGAVNRVADVSLMHVLLLLLLLLLLLFFLCCFALHRKLMSSTNTFSRQRLFLTCQTDSVISYDCYGFFCSSVFLF